MPRKNRVHERAVIVRQFLRRERRLPVFSELMALFECRSTNSAAYLMRQLEEAGYVRRDENDRLAPTQKLSGQVRVLGEVQAGFPSPAEEELVDVLSLDEWLIARPDATYLLKVGGDSMRDAGILPGDVALVERGVNPKNGAVVVAQVDGEWTLKYYHKDKTGVRLEPANPNYKVIRPQHSLTIGGVVRSVIRKYS